jgi:hypothetical protein
LLPADFLHFDLLYQYCVEARIITNDELSICTPSLSHTRHNHHSISLSGLPESAQVW